MTATTLPILPRHGQLHDRGFAALTAADRMPGVRAGAGSAHEQLVKQTQTWVAQTFFGTMLKQMRESPFRSELFDGGRGGQAFGAMYDQHLAEHMTRGAGKKLVNAIVRKIEAKKAYEKQSAAALRVPGTGTDNSSGGLFSDARPSYSGIANSFKSGSYVPSTR